MNTTEKILIVLMGLFAITLLFLAAVFAVALLSSTAYAGDCQDRYPNDFELQAYCEKKHDEAAENVIAFVKHFDIRPMTIADKQEAGQALTVAERIWLTCAEKPDRELQAYCLRRQIEAAQVLGKL